MRLPAKNRVRRIASFSVLLCTALLLSYVESLISLPFILPGIKIGISNVVLTFVLYRYGDLPAVGFGISKAFLSALFLGATASLPYSLTGMFFALAAMILIRHVRLFSLLGVNVGGAAAHVAGQLCAAVFLLGNISVLRFTPWLVCAGCVSGVLTYIPLRRIMKSFQ